MGAAREIVQRDGKLQTARFFFFPRIHTFINTCIDNINNSYHTILNTTYNACIHNELQIVLEGVDTVRMYVCMYVVYSILCMNVIVIVIVIIERYSWPLAAAVASTAGAEQWRRSCVARSTGAWAAPPASSAWTGPSPVTWHRYHISNNLKKK